MPRRCTTPPSDQTLAGRFRLEEKIGAGGMGTVYRALDLATQTRVAVKVLHARDVSVDAASRFAREATALSELAHPGIVKYVAHGELADGRLCLVMEWAAGETLKERLERVGVTVGEAVLIGRQVADALGEVHRAGLVHRDVKPKNLIFVGEGEGVGVGDGAGSGGVGSGGAVGRIKLVDFGVVRRLSQESTLTGAGAMIGSPGYLSPEQARGDRVDARSDVFALACVLYECLTGRMAFSATDLTAVVLKVLMVNPPPLRALCPEAPERLEQLLRRMMAKAPHERPRDGHEVAAELAALGALAGTIRRRVGEEDRETVQTPRPDVSGGALSSEPPLAFVVLALVGEEVEDAERDRARGAALAAVVAPFGGELQSLANQAIAVTLSASGSAPDAAARAADCARAMQTLLPGVPIALAGGGGAAPVGMEAALEEALDCAFRTLMAQAFDVAAAASNGGVDLAASICVDPRTAGLLPPRFARVAGRDCSYLV